MIDCLSNPDWIKPQIEFLLYLQNMRIGYLEIFDKFFLAVTAIGEYWISALICAIIYWCVDFRAGIYLFSMNGLNILVAHFFKMIACVYRPWVLDSRIEPSKLAVPYAKGYSFPSGHSAMSSSVLGGTAYILRHKKFQVALLIGVILLVGFSRMWLGVHTPQDVVVGFLIGFFLIFGVSALIEWAEKDTNRYLYLLIGIDILAILSMIFLLFFNSYRMDYVDGQILVDPATLKYHTIIMFSYALGLINGSFLCRRFCPFDPKEISLKRRVIRGIIGTILIVILIKYLFSYIVMNMLNKALAASLMFLIGIIITLVYPMIFNAVNRNK